VAVVTAHQERAVVRVGALFLKIESDPVRMEVELDAIRRAPVPTPAIVWHRPPVVALAAVPGRPLAQLGVDDRSSPRAWAAAGAVARQLHAAPLPPASGWRAADFRAHAETSSRWIVDHAVADAATVDAALAIACAAFRDFPLVFTHGDFQAAHVFVQGDAVTGIIDWADSCQGDPLYDLAVLTVGHEERLADVLDGYGRDVDPDEDVIRGWWAFRRLAAVPWMVEHGYDAGGDVEALRRTVGA
jgi:aminoglycoside phosphotransferase (APT) family kinase protein